MAKTGGESERTQKTKGKDRASGIGSHESKINLAALKRCTSDETILEIVGTASHVALYRFDGKSWQKTDSEGALFVFKRSVHPTYGFLIMNRLNTENMEDVITPAMEFQTQEPFVLYKSAKTKNIFGIWFYDTAEFKEVGNLIVRLSRSNQTGAQPMTAPKSGETNEGESPPAGKPQPQLLQLLANGTAGITPSHSRGSPGSTLLTQNPQPVISQVVQTPRETASLPSQDGAVSSRESLAALDPAIMALPKHAPLQASTDGMSTPRDGQTSLQSSLGSQKTPNVLQQLVATFPRTDPVQHTMPSHTIPTAQTTAHLRSPLDFQALNQRQTDAQATSQRGLSEQRDDQQTTGTRTSPSGLPVGQPSDQQMGGARSLRREVPALTREQMQQALLHLIQNDQNFVDVLHDAYIKSISSSSSQ